MKVFERETQAAPAPAVAALTQNVRRFKKRRFPFTVNQVIEIGHLRNPEAKKTPGAERAERELSQLAAAGKTVGGFKVLKLSLPLMPAAV